MTGVIVGGAVLFTAAMGALGIGIAASMNNESFSQAAQEAWDKTSDVVKAGVTYTVTAGRVVAHYTYDALKGLFQSAVTEFPQATLTYGQVGYTIHNSDLGYIFHGSTQLIYSSSGNLTYLTCSSATILQSYQSIDFSQPFVAYGHTLSAANWPKWTLDGVEIPSNSVPHFDGTYPYYVVEFRTSESNPFSIALINTCKPATENYRNAVILSGDSTASLYNGQDVFNPANDKFYADGASAMTKSVDKVIDKVKEKVGTKDGVDVDAGPATGDRTKVQDEDKTETQAQRLGKDIADTQDKTDDDTKNKEDNRDTTPPKTGSVPDLTIPELITKKFPFSIPWDLYNSVSNLSTTAKAPVFDIPFTATAVGVNTTIHIDMAKFDPVATLARWGLSLLFLIGLIILTNRMIKH